MKITRSERLSRFLNEFSGEDHILVLINADPDAIASAMAVKRLLWRKVASVTIAHVNVIKRPDNQEMIRLLGIKMAYVDSIKQARFNKTIFVDSQPDHHERFAGFKPAAIIDHHPKTDARAPYMDIRPNYGATATILTEYLRTARISPSAKLATALFIAIKTDTSNFERQTVIEDLKAFQFLFRRANIHLARRIEQAEISFDFLKYFRSALDHMKLRNGRVFVHLGAVNNPDVCVLLADFFMRLTCVDWSIVSGFNDGKLIIIMRNDGIRKDAGKVARQSFGEMGSAGGHKGMSRAEIHMTALPASLDTEDKKVVANWIIDTFEKTSGPGKGKSGMAAFQKSFFGLDS
ncbi:Kef-type K+ transport systems (NAD-binding component fused to domain related to exopolyphosphatase) [Olavius algarvensis associated proteobacterium Delta 3]|nr:Kef-type K+ transport systems (NAD-binding component fused to domain related to exopolyphosphatase) [Olavius algarvensis associated proteobacterium Delta 3]CAB5146820.1 Kef-type K+ transport systems (NAD-binding component fused to domain related to exopolyphosphatase) [Olavius algarvensis associated proteobacterium Delta 3]